MTVAPVLQDSLAFRYNLWRKHEHRRVLSGFYPEVLATDGTTVRRLMCQDKRIMFQEFEDETVIKNIISRIERAAAPGVQMVGYQHSEQSKAVAILQTGTSAQSPGWLAFPYVSHTLEFEGDPTVPFRRSMMMPQDSIRGGARIAWRSGALELQIALEQRRHSELATSADLMSYIEHVEVCAVSYKRGEPKIMDLTSQEDSSIPLTKPFAHRVEGQIVIEPSIFKAFRRTDAQVWLKMRVSREMFCLPDDWRSFWIEVDVDNVDALRL